MARLWWKAIGTAGLALTTGCAGVYAEAGLTALPTASYTQTLKNGTGNPVDTVQASAVGSGAVFNLGAGVDFDFTRKSRLGVGYELMAGGFGKDTSAAYGAIASRFDFNLINLGDNWKLRGAAGLSVGPGTGTVTVPSESGAKLEQKDVGSFGVSAGAGLSYYATPSLGFHLMLLPTYQRVGAKDGHVSGFGGTAKLTAAWTFGDTRPEAVVYEPMWSDRNVMPTIAAAARDILCTAHEMNQSSWAAVLVKCPDDKREIMFLQTPNAVMVTCQHSNVTDCKLRMREFIKASKDKLK
jgi:hypothetical protein